MDSVKTLLNLKSCWVHFENVPLEESALPKLFEVVLLLDLRTNLARVFILLFGGRVSALSSFFTRECETGLGSPRALAGRAIGLSGLSLMVDSSSADPILRDREAFVPVPRLIARAVLINPCANLPEDESDFSTCFFSRFFLDFFSLDFGLSAPFGGFRTNTQSLADLVATVSEFVLPHMGVYVILVGERGDRGEGGAGLDVSDPP